MKATTWLIVVILFVNACKRNSQSRAYDQDGVNENLTKMNRAIVENESKEIDEFILRHSFQTFMTGTGLRYQVYIHGQGNNPSIKDEVEINYRVFLLNGALCYSTDSTGPVKFRLGSGEQLRGLEEGIMLMVPGDRAHLIVPSHLAFGMTGDQEKVPPASALYIDVELINVIK
jgi:FKBP-type peptidyl-prolyl cis-trans isomerase